MTKTTLIVGFAIGAALVSLSGCASYLQSIRDQQAAEQEQQQAEEAELQSAVDSMTPQQRVQYLSAVQSCIDQAKARRASLNQANQSQALASNSGAFLGNLLGGGGKQPTDQDHCEHDPNWYQTIPLPPTVTTCGQNYMGQIVCSSSH